MSRFVTLASGLAFPEGPSVAPDGAIWVSELKAGRIARVDGAGDMRRFAVGGAPNGTVFAPDGSLWFCDQERNAVRRLDPATGDTATIADAVDGEPLAAPNDLAFAPDGSLVLSCPGDSRREPNGYLCRRSPDGYVGRIAAGLLFPNGLCFSTDGTRFYVAETYACRVVVADWANDLSFRAALDTPGPIGADGVAIDADGAIYATVYGAGIVRILDSGGSAPRDIAAPDAHPAGCAIDPMGRWRALVTGTETGVLLGLAA